MSETTKNTLISLITSVLLGGACMTIGAKLGISHDQMVQFANAAAPVILAAVVGLGTLIYKAMPKSKASIIKGAAEQPGVHAVVADPSISQAGPLKDNPKVVAPPVKVA